MTREPTIQDVLANVQDVLDTLNTFATHMDGEFHAIRNELGGEIASIKRTLTTLVTKDYLDEKISDLRGDLFKSFTQP